MAGFIGRKVLLEVGEGSPLEKIAGVREKTIAFNGEPVDVTTDDDDGWRALLSEAGQNDVTISLSGLVTSSYLRNLWMAGSDSSSRMVEARLTYPDGSVFEGSFFLASYQDGATYNDATTMEAELQSSGRVMYTPASPEV
jgi:TP901-1 family phage major tail protein